MNKRIAKPKRKTPLFPDEDVTEAQMEQFLRDNHAEIARKLAAAKRQSDAGMGKPMGSLEDLLQECRQHSKRRR